MKLAIKCLGISVVAATGLLAGCGSDSNSNSNTVERGADTISNAAVVQTVASNYSGSDVQVVDLSEDTLAASTGVLANALSGYFVKTNGTEVYHIGSFFVDTITKYAVDDFSQYSYEYGTLDFPEQNSFNAQDMVFVSDTKAYLIGMGNNAVWIVNPQAATEVEFKIGELDLSAYADGDGLAEPVDGHIVDGKLFIVVQRLEKFSPAVVDNPAFVAVFDITTDEEIDTNPLDEADNLKGIELETRNPRKLSHHEDIGLFLVSTGDAYASFNGREPSYSGGITTINTDDYSALLLVDDGDEAEDYLPFGFLQKLTLLDANNGYFVGSASSDDETLYHFNPTTGEVTGAVVGFENIQIGALETGPAGNAWVGVASNLDPRIVVMNGEQQTLTIIELMQNPAGIEFTQGN